MQWLDDPSFKNRTLEVSREAMRRIVAELEPLLGTPRADALAPLWMSNYSRIAGLGGQPVVESPIEAVFALAWAPVGMTTHPGIILHPQASIDRYRSDFAIYHSSAGLNAVQDGLALFVELDGHNFHERTPEQAERDRKRDRWFHRNGLQVIRFTGREVWRDPFECVDQVIKSYDANFGGGL